MFRLSLRELLLLIALTAVAATSLKFASDWWLACVSAFAAIALFAAAIIAVVDRGRRQAFAIGFAIVLVGYNGLLVAPDEFMPRAQSPTTMSLWHLYHAIETGRWIDSETGEELPDFDPTKAPQRLKIARNRGFPIEQYVEQPPREQFMQIGHAWWSLLLAYAGGRFASFVFCRRNNAAGN